MTEHRSAALEDTTELAADASLADDAELVADPEFVAMLQKRRLTTPATRVLLILIVLGLGFVLGAYVQKQRSPAATTGVPAGLAQLLGRNGGAPVGLGSTGGALTGTVTLVDGNNVYITDVQGNVTKVVTTADTTIKVNKDGTLADLGPSKSVTVQGSQNADGTYSATSIQEGSGGGRFPVGGAGIPAGGGIGGPPGGGVGG